MDVTLPPGYGPVVAFDKFKHGPLSVKPQAAAFAKKLSAIYLTAVEFSLAARVHPIVFGRTKEGVGVAMAVTGVVSGRNLFIDADGNWESDIYCPAYVRRYPFCAAEFERDGEMQSVICVDEAGLVDDGGEPLCDSKGESSAAWQRSQQFIKEMEVARQHTEALCRRLVEHDLLEDFEADINPRESKRQRLVGMQRVNEKSLQSLSGDAIKGLVVDGFMSSIYLHLFSLDNFAKLLDRHVKA